jgi:outer membrane protein OmpA-like peptidoglycan-associated protein
MSSISRGLLLFLIALITAGCQTTSLERTLSYNQGKLREAEEQRDRLEFQLATSERQQQEAVAELVGFQKRIADFRAKNAALTAENEMLIARPIPASAIIEEIGEPNLDGFDGIDGLQASAVGGMVTLTLDQQVLFNSGSADISKHGQQALGQLAVVLRDQFAGREIRVEGHTDASGDERANWQLSGKRATAVVMALRAKGPIPGNHLHSRPSRPPNHPGGLPPSNYC